MNFTVPVRCGAAEAMVASTQPARSMLIKIPRENPRAEWLDAIIVLLMKMSQWRTWTRVGAFDSVPNDLATHAVSENGRRLIQLLASECDYRIWKVCLLVWSTETS